eukprot:gene29140-32358_t
MVKAVSKIICLNGSYDRETAIAVVPKIICLNGSYDQETAIAVVPKIICLNGSYDRETAIAVVPKIICLNGSYDRETAIAVVPKIICLNGSYDRETAIAAVPKIICLNGSYDLETAIAAVPKIICLNGSYDRETAIAVVPKIICLNGSYDRETAIAVVPKIICLNGSYDRETAIAAVPKIICLNRSYDRETAIAAVPKIICLNGSYDRETAIAVTDSLNRKGSRWGVTLTHPPNAFITGLLLVRGTFTVDRVALAGLGIHHVMEVDPAPGECGFMYEPKAFISELKAMLSQLACGASTGGGDAESRLSLLARGVGTGGVVAESRLSQLARGAGTGGVVAESRLSQLARGAGTGGGGVENPLIHLFGGRPLSPPTPSFRGLQGGLGGAPPFGEGGHGEPSLVVFSGGTAFNMVASELRGLTSKVAYVLPVSDDGGSTAEIVRVLGGPAVGDIRSRCLRLADDSDEEAKAEWRSIVEGDHKLWRGVSEPYKHVIRAFLVHFEKELLQLMVQASVQFDFRNGSVGNFFFAGARIFFRSLDAAIFLFSRVARLPLGSVVLPAISTEGRITLGAELENGVCIRGQNQISHPPHVASTLVDKSCDFQPLPSAIRRVFYLSSEGSGQEHEVFPKANPRAMSEIDSSDAIIYGMGSLYTSICPTLCLDGTGEHVADRDVPKILCINGSHDRETSSSGAHDGPMLASDMVQAVTDALNRRRTRFGSRLWRPPSAYVTGLLVPKGGDIEVDIPKLKQLGVQYVSEVESFLDVASGSIYFQPAGLVAGIEGMIKLQSQAPVGQEYSI